MKSLRAPKSSERARKVWPLRTIYASLAHVSFHGYQRLEKEQPRWAQLPHQNILPIYGVYIFRTLPLKCSHGRTGIVTDLGPRLYMVSGSPRVRKYEVDQIPQVSPWQENGNLLTYVKNTPGVNKNHLVSCVVSRTRKRSLMSRISCAAPRVA